MAPPARPRPDGPPAGSRRGPASGGGQERPPAEPAEGGEDGVLRLPDDLIALVEAAGLQPGTWRGVSVVSDLLDVTSGADPEAVRRLELALAGSSPYRDVAAGLHLLATRP